MAKVYEKTKYKLTSENIDAISDKITDFCESIGGERAYVTRLRISAEECMGIWKEELDDGKTGCMVTFESGKRLFKPYFQISAQGKRCNPYSDVSEEFGSSRKSMLVNIGLAPTFSYVNDANIISFILKKKPRNQLVMLLSVILVAVVVGLLGIAFIPDKIIGGITENLITPVEDTVFNILSCIAGPMIFLSVAWGVYGIGDVYTLGKIGKKLMAGFLAVVYFFAIMAAFTYPFLGNGITGGNLENSQAGSIFEMILGIFPSNIVSPFLDGNTLQIIFLGFIIGMCLIFLGKKTQYIAVAIEQINYMINFLMEIISKMVPYFVFIVIVRLIWSGSLKLFSDMWSLALVFLVAYISLLLIFLVYTGIRNKLNPVKLLVTCLPSYVIALSTASSAATFESNMSISTGKLGIRESMASFSIPFGMVMFKPNTALYYTLLCFYFSSVYNVDVSVSWIAVAVFITGICAVATPPIPGGSAATYTILFLQLGIPSEALAVALAIDMIFDFLMTSGDMFSLLLEVKNVARRTGMLKTDAGKVKKQLNH